MTLQDKINEINKFHETASPEEKLQNTIDGYRGWVTQYVRAPKHEKNRMVYKLLRHALERLPRHPDLDEKEHDIIVWRNIHDVIEEVGA